MPTYRIYGWFFPRALAAVYFIAFGSWWFQFAALTGEKGLMPVPKFLELAAGYAEQNGITAWLQWPSFYWMGYSDALAAGVCLGGCIIALLVMAGVWQAPLLAVLWAGYLSIVTTSDVFMSYQWDALLLEVGFIGVLISPWRLFTGRLKPESGGPSRVQMLLPQMLLFKLMLLSGYVKLASEDKTWWNLTALQVHYETQPLPTWIGWWAHQLPGWVQVANCGIMFVIELVLPLVLLATLFLEVIAPGMQRLARTLKLIVAGGFLALMVVVMATGNYTYFNWLAILITLSVLDDHCWPRFVKRVLRLPEEPPPAHVMWGHVVQVTIVTVMLMLSLAVTIQRVLLKPENTHGWLTALLRPIEPFTSVNTYGLFAVMTTERNEIEIEVSDDGTFFLPLVFKWKPGPLDRAPAFVAPYQPRLDWQMWFAALHPGFLPERDMRGGRMVWFGELVGAILDQRQPVLDLMSPLPMPAEKIRVVRARFYRYRFTDLETRRKTGEWWTREFVGDYMPKLSKRS